MIRALLRIVRPFHVIARELTTLRQLYELELESRNPPIRRHTEEPSKSDTEVYYSGQKDERPMYKRWFNADEEAE